MPHLFTLNLTNTKQRNEIENLINLTGFSYQSQLIILKLQNILQYLMNVLLLEAEFATKYKIPPQTTKPQNPTLVRMFNDCIPGKEEMEIFMTSSL